LAASPLKCNISIIFHLTKAKVLLLPLMSHFHNYSLYSRIALALVLLIKTPLASIYVVHIASQVIGVLAVA